MSPPATIRTRGYLPHWEHDHATYFVTFRLADSLPRDFVDQVQRQRRRTAAAQRAGTAPPADLKDLRLLLRKTERPTQRTKQTFCYNVADTSGNVNISTT